MHSTYFFSSSPSEDSSSISCSREALSREEKLIFVSAAEVNLAHCMVCWRLRSGYDRVKAVRRGVAWTRARLHMRRVQGLGKLYRERSSRAERSATKFIRSVIMAVTSCFGLLQSQLLSASLTCSVWTQNRPLYIDLILMLVKIAHASHYHI